MRRRTSVRRQRIPMVDATTLEGRTRPPTETPRQIWLRLRYFSAPASSSTLVALSEKKSGRSPFVSGGSR